MFKKIHLPLFLLPILLSAQSSTLLELEFPYSTGWAQPTASGLGNGFVDLDLDGVVDDAARGLKASTPEDLEYLGTQNFTNAGPQIEMRGVLAHLDSANGLPPVKLSSHGITTSSIRLEGTRKVADLSQNMGYVGWWYIPSASFDNGGRVASFANGGQIKARAVGNPMKMVWRVLVKNAGNYYLSDVGSNTTSLEADIAATQWVLYRHAEAGLNMRLKLDPNAVKSGSELTQVEGIGIYVELIGFDGQAMGVDDRVLLDISELAVSLP